MQIFEWKGSRKRYTEILLALWEDSVKATHSFLTDEAREKIKGQVPMALEEVPHLIIAEGEDGRAEGFMGVDGEKLEMLFLGSNARGKGIGRELLTYGIQEFQLSRLDVNEQNPEARGFYEHMGFCVCGRAETDGMGNPYPILHMERR